MKITVAGMGYVGLSNAVLLAQHNDVTAFDIVEEKVDMVNRRQSPIVDEELKEYLKKGDLRLHATLDKLEAFGDAEFIVISTPTNYDPQKNCFDTSSVDKVISEVCHINPQAIMIIKSTVPIGYTKAVRKKFNTDNIIFSPEFLREGHALFDNLYPSRIVVGECSERAQRFAELLRGGGEKKMFLFCLLVQQRQKQ